MEKKQLRAGLYIRVSTVAQNLDGQEAELRQYAENRGWTVTKIYRDVISGGTRSRPGLDELMNDARKRRVDVILCWKFDRLARSVSHLLQALETLRAVGVEFVSISEQIDTSSRAGKLVFTILGADFGSNRPRAKVAWGEKSSARVSQRTRQPLDDAVRPSSYLRQMGTKPSLPVSSHLISRTNTGGFHLRKARELGKNRILTSEAKSVLAGDD